MNKPIDFERARIVSIEHKIAPGGSVTSRVKIVALATAKIARALNARYLLDKDSLVKTGFSSVELEQVIKNVRATHAIEGIGSLQLDSELATKFKVFRKGDDNKKSKRLMVSFVLHHAGAPFQLLEWLLKVGQGEGVCSLLPLQAEMFDETGKKDEVDKKASARRERRKKAMPPVMSDAPVVVQ